MWPNKSDEEKKTVRMAIVESIDRTQRIVDELFDSPASMSDMDLFKKTFDLEYGHDLNGVLIALVKKMRKIESEEPDRLRLKMGKTE
jgi:phosphoenolpyruvate carboxylase